MFYMRPSRYFPSQTSVKTIIDNLCYVMNTMHENNSFAQQEGIGFIACMDDWKMKNFDVAYCYQFMMALQGFMVPVKTQLFLIVNPPSWFGAIWKIMKPMLAPSFRKRVKICPESKISKYLAPDYRTYLPDDMTTGLVNTDELVQDFLSYRTAVEKAPPAATRSAVERGDNSSDRPSSSHAESSFEPMGSEVLSSMGSHHGSLASVGESTTTSSFHHEDDEDQDDDASIHCDIDDLDMLEDEDIKQPAALTASDWNRDPACET